MAILGNIDKAPMGTIMPVQNEVHCDLCSVFCMSLCDYLERLSAIAVGWLEERWTWLSRLHVRGRMDTLLSAEVMKLTTEKAPDAGVKRETKEPPNGKLHHLLH